MGYCSNHPDAPHGFDRNASHNAGEYVCTCESWVEPMTDKIREAFDSAQIDPCYASYNLDSFSFHLGYQAALSSLEQVGFHNNDPLFKAKEPNP